MPAEPALRGRTRQRAEAGSIAILALWGVALISILLAAATFTTRTEVRIAENAIGGSRARLAAEAGTQLGLMRLLRRRTEAVGVFDGTAESWQDGSIRVDISIIDEAGKVDLNNAPLELFAGLFIGLGRPGKRRCCWPATSSTGAGRVHRFVPNRPMAPRAAGSFSPCPRSWGNCRVLTMRSTARWRIT